MKIKFLILFTLLTTSNLFADKSSVKKTMVCQAKLDILGEDVQKILLTPMIYEVEGKKYDYYTTKGVLYGEIDNFEFQAVPFDSYGEKDGIANVVLFITERSPDFLVNYSQLAKAISQVAFAPVWWSKVAGPAGYIKLPNNPDAASLHMGDASLICYKSKPDERSFSY